MRLLVTLIMAPIRYFGAALALAMVAAVGINAAYFQDGKHPAPLAASPRQTDTLAQTDRTTVPLPAPRVTPGTSSDPLGDLVKLTDRVAAPAVPPRRPQQADADPIAALVSDNRAQGLAETLVAEIQTVLAQKGLYTGTVDGLMGPQTRTAIRAFEAQIARPETGVASPELLAVLQRGPASPEPPASLDVSALTGVQPDPLVRSVQRILADHGYAPGRVDGLMGAATREAIRRFEAHRGLTETGTITRALINELETVTGQPVG